MKSVRTSKLLKYLGNQIKKDKMGTALDMYWGEEIYKQGFDGKAWKKQTTWKTWI